MLVALLAGCELISEPDARPPDNAAGPGRQGVQQGTANSRGTNPLHNSDGTLPGLASVQSQRDLAKARDLISTVPTKAPGSRSGYDRNKFGAPWSDVTDGIPLAGNGCDTRNDLLKRDGIQVRLRAGSDCVVIAMILDDPYTGMTINWTKQQPSRVQIDHVIPLSYGWRMGASRWSAAKRKQLANDPLNLLPVDGSTNAAKGDSGPADWLPPSPAIRCAYVVRFAQVSHKYGLPVTAEDKAAMLEQCR